MIYKENKYKKFNRRKKAKRTNKPNKYKRLFRANNYSKFNKLITKYNRLKKFDKSDLLKKLQKFDNLNEKERKPKKLDRKEIWKIKIKKKLKRLKRKLRKQKKRRFIKLFKMIPSGRMNIRDNVVGHYFPTPVARLIKDQLIHAGFHLGGSIKRFRPEMSFNLLGKRHSIFLIELTGSVFYLKRGLAYIGRAALLKIPVLFVVSKKEGRDYLSDSIIKRGNYAIKGRYIPGAISNYKSVGSMPELPGVVCIGDSKNCTHSIRECINLDLPFFGICDSEMDPSWFYFPVFGNNDSLEGSRVLCYLVRETIIIQEKNLRKKFGGIASKWRRVLKGVA
jgi:ribosomal protein S2